MSDKYQENPDNVVEDPADNVGNRVKLARSSTGPDENFGNRLLPDEEPSIDDNIGNRSDGPAMADNQGGRRRRRRGRRGRRPNDDTRPAPQRRRGPRDDMPPDEPVQYVLKSDPEEKRSAAERVCGDIVGHCGREAQVSAELVDENGQPKVVVMVNEQGPGAPLFTRNSAALSALNFLTNKVVNRFPDDRIRLVVHVQGGERPAGHGPSHSRAPDPELETMARTLANAASRMGRTLSVAPVRPEVRRVVHVTLESNSEVVTMSEGEGAHRKLLVVPRSMLPNETDEAAEPPLEMP